MIYPQAKWTSERNRDPSVAIRTKITFPMTPSGMRKNNFLKSGSSHDTLHDSAGPTAAPPAFNVMLRAGDKTVPVQRFMMGKKHASAVLALVPFQYSRFGFRQVDDDQTINDIAECGIDIEPRDLAS
jgi:hypothetical protein